MNIIYIQLYFWILIYKAVVRMKIELSRNIRNLVIFVAILVVMVQGVMAPASSEPSYIPPSGTINVDGDPSEWNLTNDFFANMYKAAESDPTARNYELLSELYLRYDCKNETLYAMVLVESNHVLDDSAAADNHYIKINKTGKSKIVVKLVDGNAPDFHYILNGNSQKIGWEASTNLTAGSYQLNVHTQVDNDETSAVTDRDIPLTIICGTNDIPEFPTIALPIAAILGLMFIFGRKRDL